MQDTGNVPAPSADAPVRPRGLLRYQGWMLPEIVAFQRQAYPHRRLDWIEPRYRWMFVESAARVGVEPMAWVYRTPDGVVAHQGAIAVRLRAAGHELTTGWFVETMALESVRGKSIGPMVVAKALQDLPLNLSLGQTAQMRELQYRLGWKRVAPLDTYALVLDPKAVLAGKVKGAVAGRLAALALGAAREIRRLPGVLTTARGYEVRAIDRFDDRHDALWNRVKRRYRCAVVRDASYLNWKYVAQPGQRFVRLEASLRGEAAGVVVFQVLPADDTYRYTRAMVVEFLADPADAEAMHVTLDGLRAAAREHGAALVVFDVIGDAQASALTRHGYLRRDPTRFLLVATGGAPPDVADALLSPAAWYVTHGDSDIDRPWALAGETDV